MRYTHPTENASWLTCNLSCILTRDSTQVVSLSLSGADFFKLSNLLPSVICETEMKRMDIFCASQASTAICLSLDQSSSSSSTIQLGGKALDRHNPIIFDGVRTRNRALPTNPPCSFHSPIHPKPYHQLHKSRKSSSKPSKEQTQKNSANRNEEKKKNEKGSKPRDDAVKKGSFMAIDIVRRSCVKPDNSATPPGSSRYLLRNSPFFDGLSDVDPVLAIVPSESKSTIITKQEDKAKPSSSSQSTKPSSSNQVVVLRVSLHCKGCEGKVRKHISKMEGVTSFHIDFASKKVTIMGDIVPLKVLESVSKVKNAQFWTSTLPPASASSFV